MFPLTHFVQMRLQSDLSGASPISSKVAEPLPMRFGAVFELRDPEGHGPHALCGQHAEATSAWSVAIGATFLSSPFVTRKKLCN